MKITANITYKSVLPPITKEKGSIEKRNEVFNNLNPQSMRLEIAWEALQMVINRTMLASNGWYWGDNLDQINESADNAKAFQKALLKVPQCRVCQRGLMMVSQIRLGNTIKPGFSDTEKGTKEIIKGFKIIDFERMEMEFENNRWGHPYYTNTDEKLANICCNVLVNGNFNKNDKTDYLTVKY